MRASFKRSLGQSLLLLVAFAFSLTALVLGSVVLFTARRDSVVAAMPHMAVPYLSWLTFTVGFLLLVACSTVMAIDIRGHRRAQQSVLTRGADQTESEPMAVQQGDGASMILKPSGAKIQSGLLNLIFLSLALPLFGITEFVIHPRMYGVFIMFFFISVGFMTLANVADDLSCRVQISEKEIRFSSLFREKTFPAREIRSAKVSGYRSTTNLTVYGDRSWFTVSSNSFDTKQLGVIRQYCNRAAN
jgi:hypothetical protein